MYTFIPIFVTIDVSGLIPMYLSLTKGLSEDERRLVSWQAIFTAFVISAAFIVVGQLVFKVLGISVADFEIAGGILLLVLGIAEMLFGDRRKSVSGLHAGPVPLGTPLIVGPAVLTSLIILIPLRGYGMTFVALLVNLIIVMVAFKQSRRLVQVIGEDGLRATSQVICLFLAAIAVSMIRRGIQTLLLP
ncbi:MAG: MarC family protein [Elusimicrobiota bacterium]